MTTRKTTVAAVAIAAALTLAACGSDDSNDASPTTTTAAATTTTETVAAPPLPTAAELNALLMKGLDPATPLDEKIAMVQGSEQDPNLFDQVAAAAQQAGAQVEVLDPVIDNGDGGATAQLQLTINGDVQPNTLPANFVPGDDGTWKLSTETACAIVAIAQLTSPACPPA